MKLKYRIIPLFKIISFDSVIQTVNTALSTLVLNSDVFLKMTGYVSSKLKLANNLGQVMGDLLYGINGISKVQPSIKNENFVKYLWMILRTAIDRLPTIRQDKKLPQDTKDLMTRKAIFDSFIKMANVHFSKEFEDIITEFEAASKTIGLKLIEEGDTRARYWNIRDRSLWEWCYVLIKDTAHPSYFWLLNQADSTDKAEAKEKYDTIFESLVKTVMWVSFPDDMADNYKHVELTQFFNEIPFASNSKIDEIRSKVASIDDGLFSEYFEVAVKVWKSAESDFRRIIGDAYDDNIHHLKENYTWIKRSMEYSAKMNAGTLTKPLTNIETHLQHNMMATSFNTVQTMLCKAFQRSDFPVKLLDPFTDSTLDTFRRLAQENARRSNNIATFRRELNERDISNIMFSKINDWLSRQPDKSKTYQATLKEIRSSFSTIYETGISIDSTFSFFTLLNEREAIEESLFQDYQHCDTQSHFKNCYPDVKKAIQKITSDLDKSSMEDISSKKRLIEQLNDLILEIAKESNVFEDYYREWEDCRKSMVDLVDDYFQKDKDICMRYIKGWDNVHATYLAMRYETIF